MDLAELDQRQEIGSVRFGEAAGDECEGVGGSSRAAGAKDAWGRQPCGQAESAEGQALALYGVLAGTRLVLDLLSCGCLTCSVHIKRIIH